METEVYTYVAFNHEGKARAFVRDDPNFATDTAKMVSGWIKAGRTIKRMTWAEMHAAMNER